MDQVHSDTPVETGIPSTSIGNTRKISRLPVDRQRAEFLRSCRARIKPSDLGLPVPQRKRTDGLRREDVAALSGVSVSWYTWLEQGREMRVSDEVLERICQTFRLSALLVSFHDNPLWCFPKSDTLNFIRRDP